MYSLLVVDDEKWVQPEKNGTINWESEKIRLIDSVDMELVITGQAAYNSLVRMKNVGGAFDSRLSPGNMLLAVVKILDWGKVRTNGRDRPAIRYELGKLAEETCAGWGEALSCPLNNYEDADLAILYNGLTDESHENKEMSLVQGLTLFAQSAGQHLDVQLSVGVGGECSWEKLHRTFDEAVHACAYAYYEGPGKIHSVSKLPKLPGAKRPYKGPNASWENQIFHAMKLGDVEQVQHLVEELCEHVRASKDKYSPLSVYRGLTSLIRNVIHRWASSSPKGEGCLNGLFTVQLPADGFLGLRDYLGPMFQKYCHKAKSGGSRNKIIELALDYIEEHFTEDIMMSMVAKDHYVNPSYFSKLFHEETGETFSKYVARLRIEKAKHLLRNSTLKIYEITLQVGYNDFRHFIKTFKQLEGITPAQYRNLGRVNDL